MSSTRNSGMSRVARGGGGCSDCLDLEGARGDLQVARGDWEACASNCFGCARFFAAREKPWKPSSEYLYYLSRHKGRLKKGSFLQRIDILSGNYGGATRQALGGLRGRRRHV